jgi:uncharacterized protein (TIGR02996 family)
MNDVTMLLKALERDPGDDAAWLALADALEEAGDPRGECTRLAICLRRRLNDPKHPCWESRLRELTEQGVRVCLPRRTVRLIDGVEMEMVLVPPGSFRMGSPEDEPSRCEDEHQHTVTLTRGFWLGIHPVTQPQWQAIMGDNPSAFPGDRRPVERTPWEDCQEFCARLRRRPGLPFRLPTEAEWEYACRAGTTTAFSFGNVVSTDRANYDGDFTWNDGPRGIDRKQTTAIGTFAANPWGLYDMHGNVWEWCEDWYGPYATGPVADPLGTDSASDDRVRRGGSWYDLPRHCRSAGRHKDVPRYRLAYTGCRLALDVA